MISPKLLIQLPVYVRVSVSQSAWETPPLPVLLLQVRLEMLRQSSVDGIPSGEKEKDEGQKNAILDA